MPRGSGSARWLLLLALLEGGCAERFLDFRVQRLLGLRVTKIEATGFEMQVRCELLNPNPLGASLEDVLFRVRLG